jgi:LPXTG-site transpeptidase (sortase) family protein
MVAALVVTVTIGATACSGNPGAVVAPSVSTPVTTVTSSRTTQPSPPKSPAPTPRRAVTLARSTPVRLQITGIGVDSTLMSLGLGADGTLEVPKGGFPAGWYTGGPTPGELGPAVIAGHVDMNGPGVFYRLHKMKPGDQVMITRADGSKPVFRVTQVEQYLKDNFPTKLVYGNLDHAGLRLITCGGTFNSQTGHYEDDLVVFADLITPAR